MHIPGTHGAQLSTCAGAGERGQPGRGSAFLLPPHCPAAGCGPSSSEPPRWRVELIKETHPVKVLLWIRLGALFATMVGTKVCSDAEGMEKHFYAFMECVCLLMIKLGEGLILPSRIFVNVQN